MAIFLTERLQVIVQGMTGSEGTQAHPADARLRHQRSSAGVNPAQGRPDRRLRRRATLPVFGTVADAIAETGADVSVVFVPPRFTKAAVVEAIDAGMPLVVVITEGVPVHDTAAFFQYAAERRHHPDHRPELPRPDQPRQVQRRHHPGRHHQGRPDRPGVASRAR